MGLLINLHCSNIRNSFFIVPVSSELNQGGYCLLNSRNVYVKRNIRLFIKDFNMWKKLLFWLPQYLSLYNFWNQFNIYQFKLIRLGIELTDITINRERRDFELIIFSYFPPCFYSLCAFKHQRNIARLFTYAVHSFRFYSVFSTYRRVGSISWMFYIMLCFFEIYW